MKNKRLLLFWIVLLVNLFTVYLSAQNTDKKIDTIPNKIRTIDRNYKEKYLNNSDFDYTEKGPTLLQRIKQWMISKIVEFFNTTDINAAKIFHTIKISFYVIVLLGVIYMLIKMFLDDEFRWIFKKKSASGLNEYKNIAENIGEVDFEELIRKALKEGNFRLAIRYNYLWLLKALDKRLLIHYDVEKTNFDYQMELSGSPFTEDFQKASYYYSYIWYGEFPIGEKEYAKTSLVFNKLLKQITHV